VLRSLAERLTFGALLFSEIHVSLAFRLSVFSFLQIAGT
jgi:hypothetical protein